MFNLPVVYLVTKSVVRLRLMSNGEQLGFDHSRSPIARTFPTLHVSTYYTYDSARVFTNTVISVEH